MKKAFISFAFAAALFCGANAQTTATVPNWYSYQGVSDIKNADITVVFYIVTGEDLAPVYAEKHEVKTNAAGAFSCQLGLGTLEAVDSYDTKEAISEIDWEQGPYKVQTWINGDLVGTAELGSVPYATLAGKALGIAGVEGDLNEVIEDLYKGLEQKDEYLTQAMNAQAEKDAEQDANIADAFVYIDEQLANINPVWGMITHLDELVEKNADDIAAISSDLPDLTEAVHQNTVGRGLLTTKVEALEAAVAALGGAPEVDLSAVNAKIAALETEVNTNIEAIEDLQQFKVENAPAIKGNTAAIAKLQEEVNTNIEAIEDLQQFKVENAPAIKGNTAAIAQLNQYMEGAYERLESVETLATQAASIAMANEEALDGLKNEHKALWDEIIKLNNLLDIQGQALADLKAMVTGAHN